jgi:hypothetical protein
MSQLLLQTQFCKIFDVCCFLLLSGSWAGAADILIALMEDYRGERTVHTQTTSGENCDAFLAELRKVRADGKRMQLTFQDPPFSGYVVEGHCVRPDGSIRGP